MTGAGNERLGSDRESLAPARAVSKAESELAERSLAAEGWATTGTWAAACGQPPCGARPSVCPTRRSLTLPVEPPVGSRSSAERDSPPPTVTNVVKYSASQRA